MGNFTKGIKQGKGILIEEDCKTYGVWDKGVLSRVLLVERSDGCFFSGKI